MQRSCQLFWWIEQAQAAMVLGKFLVRNHEQIYRGIIGVRDALEIENDMDLGASGGLMNGIHKFLSG
jgi:hypothetical protein